MAFDRIGGVAVAIALVVGGGSVAMAASSAAPGPSAVSPGVGSSAPSPGRPARGPAPAPATASTSNADGTTRPAAPSVSQDAAARSRMHECGHQWSTMKKAGAVGTLTWKEFSATCLVVSR